MELKKKVDRPQPYQLRIPSDLKERLEEDAARNRRSLNGEIIYRLQESRKAQEAAHAKTA